MPLCRWDDDDSLDLCCMMLHGGRLDESRILAAPGAASFCNLGLAACVLRSVMGRQLVYPDRA
jgi:hypothetical protein